MTCQVCGRPLRNDVSRARRAGPTCWKATHQTARRTPPTTEHTAIPGQTELPLSPIQPTLWSL